MAVPLPQRALHLTGISVFAVAQPLFDILARHGEFFAIRQSHPVDVFVLVLVLTLGLPIPLVALSAVAGRFGARICCLIQVMLIGMLAALIPLPALVRYGAFAAPAVLCFCLLVGVAVGVLYARFDPVRRLLTYLSVGALSLPLLFLSDPAIRKTAFPATGVGVTTTAVAATTPVVLVVFDEFPTSSILGRRSLIDGETFPNFAALAEESVWFRNATVVATNTHMSVPSILTGNNPASGLHPTLHDHPRNLLALLENDYRVDASEQVTSLKTPDPATVPTTRQRLTSLFRDLRVVYLHLFLPAEWSGDLPPISQSWKNFAQREAQQREKQLEQRKTRRARLARGKNAQTRRMHGRARELYYFAERLDASPRSMWFMHTILPHGPHNLYPSGRAFSSASVQPSGEGAHAGAWSDDEWAVNQAYQRHLLQVSLVDRLLGHLIERLRQTGLWDEAVIIFTADHGISFRAGDSRRVVTGTNFADIISVPLFVRAPGMVGGRIDDSMVRSTDILPTVIDLLDIELHWPLDGTSLLDPSIASRTETVGLDGDASRRFSRRAVEQGRTAAVTARLAMFDDERPADLFAFGPYGHLVGRRWDAFPINSAGGFRGRLETPERYRNVSLGAPQLPGLVVGRIELGPDDPLPWIAVAVNGTIQSVTRPYQRYRAQPEVLWSAVIPESSLQGGSNDIDMFVLEASPDGQVALQRVERSGASTDFRGITLGAAPVWGVRERGFHESGATGRKPQRWTNGRALLVVPVDPDDPPRELEVTLLGWGPKAVSDLRLVVNATELYSGPVPGKKWTKSLSLDGLEPAETLSIEIVSETWGPNNDKGVLVQGVRLR